MKKIYITILMFLAIFLNIDGVRADIYTLDKDVQYESSCTLTSKGGNYCNYSCKVTDGGDNYIQFDYAVTNTAGIKAEVQNFKTGGSDCSIFPAAERANEQYLEPLCKTTTSGWEYGKKQTHTKTYYGVYEFSDVTTEIFRKDGEFRCPSVNVLVDYYKDEYTGGYTQAGSTFSYNKKFKVSVIKDENQREEDIKDFIENETTDYCSIFGDNLTPLIKWGFGIIRIAVALIFVVMTILDFLKLAGTGEEKNYKDALNKFIKRLIIVVLIEVLPIIISILIDISGILEQYNIQDDIFCSLF